jgi:hypothetical protein
MTVERRARAGAAGVERGQVEALAQRGAEPAPERAQIGDRRDPRAARIHEQDADPACGLLGGQPRERELERLAAGTRGVVDGHAQRGALESVAAVTPAERGLGRRRIRRAGACQGEAERTGEGAESRHRRGSFAIG